MRKLKLNGFSNFYSFWWHFVKYSTQGRLHIVEGTFTSCFCWFRKLLLEFYQSFHFSIDCCSISIYLVIVGKLTITRTYSKECTVLTRRWRHFQKSQGKCTPITRWSFLTCINKNKLTPLHGKWDFFGDNYESSRYAILRTILCI